MGMPKVNYDKMYAEIEKADPKAMTEYGIAMNEKTVKIIPMEVTQSNIIFGHLGVKRNNPDYFKLKVMNYILGGGGFASCLLKDLRDKRGLTYGVYSYYTFGLAGGTFMVSMKTKNESAYEALKGILDHIKRIREKKVSQKEYDEALSYLTGSYFLKLDTNRKMADVLGVISMYDLGKDYLDTYITELKSVTREDILDVARRYLNTDKYQIVIVGDEKAMGKQKLLKTFQ